MKKTLALLLTAALILLAGCALFPSPPEPPVPDPPAPPTRLPSVIEEAPPSPFTGYQVILDGAPVQGAFYQIPYDDITPSHLTLLAVLYPLEIPVTVLEGTVRIEAPVGEITFAVGSHDFTRGGLVITLDEASFEVDGTVYVPVEFFSEVYGMQSVTFDGEHLFLNN